MEYRLINQTASRRNFVDEANLSRTCEVSGIQPTMKKDAVVYPLAKLVFRVGNRLKPKVCNEKSCVTHDSKLRIELSHPAELAEGEDAKLLVDIDAGIKFLNHLKTSAAARKGFVADFQP